MQLLINDAIKRSQHQNTVNTVFCVSENLIDSVSSEASKSSNGHFRIEHDISNRNLSPDDLPMDAPFQELMVEIIQKAEVTA
jgi:hypothetical protein